MIEKGKLSPYQLFSLMTGYLAGSSVVMANLTSAGRDTWISSLIGGLMGIMLMGIYTALARRFPGKTLVEYTELLFGKILGKIVVLAYLWYFLHLGAIVLRNFGALMADEFMRQTPLWFFNLTLALAVALFIQGGVEVMGRTSSFLFPLGITYTFIGIFLVAASGLLNLNNFLPLGETGWGSILKGSLPLFSFPYGETIIFAMLFPFINVAQQRRKVAVSALFVMTLVITSFLILGIGTFGENMASFLFPIYEVTRLISVGQFVERIDTVVLAVWIFGFLVKIGVCLYAFVLGLAQCFKLREYRSLTYPSMALMVVLSLVIYNNNARMLEFAVNIYPIYVLPFQVFLPVTLFIFALLKHKQPTGN